MDALNDRLLPVLVTRERAKAHLTQRQLAERAGLFQTVVCAIEKGRRTPVGADTIKRLITGLGLAEERVYDFVAAAEHDRIVTELQKGCLSASAPIVSAALMAGHYLDEAERRGLERKIKQSIESKTWLNELRRESFAAGDPDQPST